jgi:tripartite-type tricarboxylate transporter receptor subunit TctC
MTFQSRLAGTLAALGLAAFGACMPASAQDAVAQFYKGKTLTIVVGSSAGGGYDLYARMIARVISRHIPGNPSVVVNNMPGAASNVAAAYIYNVAPKDGTYMAAIFMGAVVDPLFSDKARPTHDVTKFNFIGNANKDYYVCLVRSDASVKTFAEVFDKELILGASAEGASTRDFPTLLRNVLGAKFKIVAGYPGTREINLAIEKGEVQGGCGQSWSSAAATYPSWFRDGLVKVLVQEDAVGYPDLKKEGVPLARDFAKTPEQREILDLVYSQTAYGRPYIVAPTVPNERVEALRKAFMAAMQDPDLVAEAKRINLDVVATPGEELQAMITKIYATPADVVERARQALVFNR